MSKIVFVTGASSSLGGATARALADAGHIVYAGIGPGAGLPPGGVAVRDGYDRTHNGRLRPVALDVADQRSVATAVGDITAAAGRIDVVVHTVGPVPRGPVESFTPYQLAQIYDAHVLSTQRVNRAVLPQMRERRDGVLIWTVTTDHTDGTPYLALHSEAVTVIEHLANSYATELTGFGIETTIVVSGSLMPDTGRQLRPLRPDDIETADAYEARYPGLVDRVDAWLAERAVTDSDVTRAAQAIVAVVDSQRGTRPLRVAPGLPEESTPGRMAHGQG